MASVMFASAAQVMPILFAGTTAVYLASKSNSQGPERKNKAVDKHKQDKHKAVMEEYGMSASHWQAELAKAAEMGSDKHRGMEMNHFRPKGETLLAGMMQDHVELAQYDRKATLLSMHANVGNIRPRQRNPIVATLTEEITHPNDASRSTSFGKHRHIINNPNHTQARIGRINAEQANVPYKLRHSNNGEYFGRAPGQSFRYSEY